MITHFFYNGFQTALLALTEIYLHFFQTTTRQCTATHIEQLIPQNQFFQVPAPVECVTTQVMEQVAKECKVALVAYTITHHTRQSAVGLPFIEKKVYSGKEYSVTEYTMSEIIAAVYEVMEDTGICEGILFLDEINCVSETLAPAMLQFLQYKTFGQHKVPEGWIIVTAGNPPEYNHSVREFDIASWDRVKRMDVEPDYSVWKTYAYEQGMDIYMCDRVGPAGGDWSIQEYNLSLIHI